jgi:quercetin dioxygenase-like cupin family protein
MKLTLKRILRHRCLPLAAGAAAVSLSAALAVAAAPQTPPGPPTQDVLMRQDVVGLAGKEVEMSTVSYLPGGASLPHQHHAQVFVYMLSGRMRMQVRGGPEVVLSPGQTFYEGPDDVHVVSANASATEPATFLVFILKDKHSP